MTATTGDLVLDQIKVGMTSHRIALQLLTGTRLAETTGQLSGVDTGVRGVTLRWGQVTAEITGRDGLIHLADLGRGARSLEASVVAAANWIGDHLSTRRP